MQFLQVWLAGFGFSLFPLYSPSRIPVSSMRSDTVVWLMYFRTTPLHIATFMFWSVLSLEICVAASSAIRKHLEPRARQMLLHCSLSCTNKWSKQLQFKKLN